MTALAKVDCPPSIANEPIWLCWRLVQRPGQAKPSKIPYYADGGVRGADHGSGEDRARLVTFAEAKVAARRMNATGIGMAFLGGVAGGIDFDACADPEIGTVNPDVLDLVRGSYVEWSPSGTGIHAIVLRASLPVVGNPKSKGVEVFQEAGFLTFTGDRLPSSATDLGPVPASLQTHLEGLFSPVVRDEGDDPFEGIEPQLGASLDDIERALEQLDPNMSRDAWIRVFMGVHHETGGSGAGFEIVHEWSRKATRAGAYAGREDCANQWQSLKERRRRGQPVTFKSVLGMVRAAGGEAPRSKGKDTAAKTPGEKDAAKKAAAQLFLVEPADTFADRPPPDWIIDGVLPAADLAIVYGESGSGKTFAVLDMVMSIVHGATWFDHVVKRQMKVLYVVAEGGGGFRKRLRAIRQARGKSLEGLGVIAGAPSFLSDEHPEVIGQRAKEWGAGLIVIDTLARVAAGANENSAEDMGGLLERCGEITRVSGAMVVLIHHSGKDAARGARGWSGIRAAADVELEVSRCKAADGTPGAVRVIKATKQKDGDDGDRWAFTLEEVLVGVQDDGTEISSCVIAPADAPNPLAQARPRSPEQRLALDLLDELMADGIEEIDLAHVVEKFLERRAQPSDRTTRANGRRTLERAINGASEAFIVSDGKIRKV